MGYVPLVLSRCIAYPSEMLPLNSGARSRYFTSLKRCFFAVPVSPPLNLIANSSFTEIQLSWQPIPPDDVNGILLGYKILYRQQGTTQWTEQIVHRSALEATVASLSEYTDYEIKIMGYNSKGQGPFSPILNLRTKGSVDLQSVIKGALFETILVTFNAE